MTGELKLGKLSEKFVEITALEWLNTYYSEKHGINEEKFFMKRQAKFKSNRTQNLFCYRVM